MNKKIGMLGDSLEEIQRRLRGGSLTALRQLLPDQDILDACREVNHCYRERTFGPVVTAFHFLLQAIQREQSFEATCQELWTPVVAAYGLDPVTFNSSATSQARSRFPAAVFDRLVQKACILDDKDVACWEGFRLLALDCATVSMPAEAALFAHFGRHRARETTVQYPLATFSALLTVGNSLLVDHGFGPFDPGESKSAQPVLDRNLRPGDLLLADRGFSSGPSCVRIRRRGADFLMRKNARLKVDKLPVLQRLGRNDFITEVPISPVTLKTDPTLPLTYRVRIFKASIKTPAGKRIEEWFVTSLKDAKRFPPKKLARLYHRRWQVETSFLEFKVWFHADVLRGKTVDNVAKEFTAHVLAYQLVRRLIVQAARKHHKRPTELSCLNAVRWILCFSGYMRYAPASALPLIFDRMLDAIAFTEIDVRPGRIEPRAITRERKHYSRLRIPRPQWRQQYFDLLNVSLS